MPLLETDELVLLERKRRRGWFRYDLEEKASIDGVSFSVDKGKSYALVGEEQSGKHALAMALLKLHPVHSGTITFAQVVLTEIGDRHFRRLRRRFQAVFPDSFGQLTSEFTVDQMFAEVLRAWYRKEDKASWHRRIERAMIACGLPEAVRILYPAELDAVERQQVALARALLLEPELLLCHGFTRGLDAVQEAELLNLVCRVRDEYGLSLVVTTDDLAVAHQLGDDIGVLHRGKLVETGPAGEVVGHPAHDYTKRLVSCSL